jgi:SnoaL-like domain
MISNGDVVRDHVAAFNVGDFDAMRALFTDDAKIHGVLGHGGFDDALPIWTELHGGMSMTLSVEAIACDGANVALRLRETGRFVGPFQGLAEYEPTGRAYVVPAMEWFVLREGKIAERWGTRDFAAIARQVLAE